MQEIFIECFEIIIRTVIAFVVLFLLARLMGVRSISQLTFYDYIVGITIGSIAATMALDAEVPIYDTLLAMIVFGLLAFLVSFLTMKSMKMRRFFSGTPTILVYKGKIIEKNLKSRHFDVNDLLCSCRENGYFNLNDIEFVIMEMNGEISVLPKSEKRPVNPEDLSMQPQQEELSANIIIDGKIMENNLKSIGKEENWLKKQLENQNVSRIHDVLLATADINGNLSVFLKGQKLKNENVFE